MNGEILFLAHRLPFPPDRGDKIRSHHVLKALAQIAPVHVGCLAETPADFDHLGELEALAASWSMPRRARSLPLAGLEALWRGEPVSMAAFRSAKLAHWVRQVLDTRDISAIYVFSGQMGQYVPADFRGRLVVDLVDVDSAKFDAYGAGGKGPRAWIDRREGKLLRKVEAELVRRADCTLLVSEAEADLLRSRVEFPGNISALRNGIDCLAYDPAKVLPHPALDPATGPHVVFTGQMDYAPNVAAVERFARQVLPRLREAFPTAQFHVVGRAPTAAVQVLGREPGVTVWGEVPDVKPFLAAAQLVTAPLTIARGVQNKVLEAMAMECCLLLTPEAATGIEARHGEHFAVAASDDELVAQASALLASAEDRWIIGKAARRFVLEGMSWQATLAGLETILSGVERPAGARNAA
ncbi:MAG: TIGR03087 family PEP-CTERM/XrtA system glycosyltransferase [Erythrobacter sp.]|nr:TIGR03087 family PEP-CTERM/XrtA system glycosyltransferase [Erythrobacter sp.]